MDWPEGPAALSALADDISSGRITDRAPMHLAWLGNRITDRDYGDLGRLYDAYRDHAKSRWFDEARAAFDARYGASGGGSTAPADFDSVAASLLPGYLFGLDQTVHERNLKNLEIRDAASKMLRDLDRTYVGQCFANMGSVSPFEAPQPTLASTAQSALRTVEPATSHRQSDGDSVNAPGQTAR